MNSFIQANTSNFQWTAKPGLIARLRQIILRLSALGQRPMNKSGDSARDLEHLIRQALSAEDFAHLKQTLATVYPQVVENDDAQNDSTTRVRQQSQSSLEEPGVSGARMLAQQLLTITRG